MSLAYWCVLVAALLPLAFAVLAKAGGRGFSNRRPRAWLTDLEGWRQRANWAQQNTFEAFPPFAAAVIIAHQLGADQSMINVLAVAFIGFRIAYGAAYLGDKPTLRSLLWLGGLLCVIGLFLVAASA